MELCPPQSLDPATLQPVHTAREKQVCACVHACVHVCVCVRSGPTHLSIHLLLDFLPVGPLQAPPHLSHDLTHVEPVPTLHQLTLELVNSTGHLHTITQHITYLQGHTNTHTHLDSCNLLPQTPTVKRCPLMLSHMLVDIAHTLTHMHSLKHPHSHPTLTHSLICSSVMTTPTPQLSSNCAHSTGSTGLATRYSRAAEGRGG